MQMNSQKLWNIGIKSALAINIIREWNLLTFINYQTKGCSLQECNSSNKHGDLPKKQEILSIKTGVA